MIFYQNQVSDLFYIGYRKFDVGNKSGKKNEAERMAFVWSHLSFEFFIMSGFQKIREKN